MKIVIAKTAGFCMGVRRAVELALDAANKRQGPIYTFGPLIHNPQVLGLLKEKGISVLSEIPARAEGTVIVRAHGIPPGTHDALYSGGCYRPGLDDSAKVRHSGTRRTLKEITLPADRISRCFNGLLKI